jgi:hypothetical protein
VSGTVDTGTSAIIIIGFDDAADVSDDVSDAPTGISVIHDTSAGTCTCTCSARTIQPELNEIAKKNSEMNF